MNQIIIAAIYQSDEFLKLSVLILIIGFIGEILNNLKSYKKAFKGLLLILLIMIAYSTIKVLFIDGRSDSDTVTQFDERLTKQVVATDKSMALSIPKYFDFVDLKQPGSVLEVGNFEIGVFIRVINDPKYGLEDIVEPTLSVYSTLLMHDTKDLLTNGQLSYLGEFFVNNSKGLRYRLDGYVNKFEFSYLYNIIESKDNFFVIVAFTTKTNFKRYFKTFIGIVDTFKGFP